MAQEKHRWLLHVFDSEYFMFWMAIKCLFKYQNKGIHQYICFQLFRTRQKEILFYYPQLFHLMLAEEGPPWSKPLFRMLYRVSKKERHLPLILSMYALSVAGSFHSSTHIHKMCIELSVLFAQTEKLNSTKPSPSNVKAPQVKPSRRISAYIYPTSLYLRYLKKTYGSKVGMSPSTKILLEQQIMFYGIPKRQIFYHRRPTYSPKSIIAALLSGVLFFDSIQHSFLQSTAGVYSIQKTRSRNTNQFFNHWPRYSSYSSYSPSGVPPLSSIYKHSKEAYFIQKLNSISNSLIPIQKTLRDSALSTELNLLNLFLPERICLPLICNSDLDTANPLNPHTDLLRVCVFASKALDSASRAPFLLVYEAANETVLPKSISFPSPQIKAEVSPPGIPQGSKDALLRTAIKILSGLKELDSHTHVNLDILSIKTRVIRKIYTIAAPVPQKRSVSHAEEWASAVEQIRSSSGYSSLPGWSVRSLIVKTGADMKQEQLATQLLYAIKSIWRESKIPLSIQAYSVLVTGKGSGLVETITGARSIHQIKKALKNRGKHTLLSYFEQEWGGTLESAKEAFFMSLVGYSIVSYILQIKDRHNGNILIDSSGRMLHIDFGFVLGAHPGFYSVEAAPFKFSVEYADVVGPARMARFRQEFLRGYLSLRKNMDHIVTLVESVSLKGSIPCVTPAATDALRERFAPGLTEEEFIAHTHSIVTRGMKSVFTDLYDSLQYYTQGYCR